MPSYWAARRAGAKDPWAQPNQMGMRGRWRRGMDLHIIDHPGVAAVLHPLFGPQATQQLGPLGQLCRPLSLVIGVAEGRELPGPIAAQAGARGSPAPR